MTTVQPVRIRTDEFERMTDVGLFDGRHVELVEGTLYEMPPMRTPHLLVLVRLQQLLAPMNAERRLLVQVPVQVPDFDEPEPDLAVRRETDSRTTGAAGGECGGGRPNGRGGRHREWSGDELMLRCDHRKRSRAIASRLLR